MPTLNKVYLILSYEVPACNLLPQRWLLLKQYTISSTPFRDLPLVQLFMHLSTSAPKSRLSWPILTFKINVNKTTWRFVYFCFTTLSRSFVETTIKANRIGPDNRDWGALAGKCINNRTRGRSRKGRNWSCIVLEGGNFEEISIMQVIPFDCVLISKFVYGFIKIIYDMTGEAASTKGLGSGSNDHIPL